jgi:hypothetical protein
MDALLAILAAVLLVGVLAWLIRQAVDIVRGGADGGDE